MSNKVSNFANVLGYLKRAFSGAVGKEERVVAREATEALETTSAKASNASPVRRRSESDTHFQRRQEEATAHRSGAPREQTAAEKIEDMRRLRDEGAISARDYRSFVKKATGHTPDEHGILKTAMGVVLKPVAWGAGILGTGAMGLSLLTATFNQIDPTNVTPAQRMMAGALDKVGLGQSQELDGIQEVMYNFMVSQGTHLRNSQGQSPGEYRAWLIKEATGVNLTPEQTKDPEMLRLAVSNGIKGNNDVIKVVTHYVNEQARATALLNTNEQSQQSAEISRQNNQRMNEIFGPKP